MAEWSCSGLQIRVRRFDSGLSLHIKMRIGIIGLGFVGSALKNAIKDDVEVFEVDPKLNTNVKDLLDFKPEIIFICVPTPMKKNGSQNISIIDSVLKELGSAKEEFLIIIKSTITPDNLNIVSSNISNIVYNPEFLREKSANEDFISSKLIIFGGESHLTKKASDFYKRYTYCKQKNHKFTDIISASLIKYTINSFLATKVIFFNQLKSVFDMSNSEDSWENFTKILSIDERIGSSHMDVPGHDGRLGFGGACFPKDTKALLKYSKNLGINFSLLEKMIETNNNIRSVYNDEIFREKEQNINFKND